MAISACKKGGDSPPSAPAKSPSPEAMQGTPSHAPNEQTATAAKETVERTAVEEFDFDWSGKGITPGGGKPVIMKSKEAEKVMERKK